MAAINAILKDLRQGRMIILTDREERENEADLVCSASKITPAKIAFMARYGRGLICVPLTAQRARELELPPMIEKNTSPLRCQFTVSVDAKAGVTTGISAFDRARTIHALLNPAAHPEDFTRPGHVFPLIGDQGGVLARDGHTEGAIDLMRLAGLPSMAVICEIMGDDGKMLRRSKLKQFAKNHRLRIFSISALIEYKPLKQANSIFRKAAANLKTKFGVFRVLVYQTLFDSKEHIVLIKGEKNLHRFPTLVRIHSECITGDLFRSLRCDCEEQFQESLRRIGIAPAGIFIYLRHEGRGIGLINKLKAYNLQDQGFDTVEANVKLGFRADARDYTVAAAILKDLGISEIHFMTNNPKKIEALESAGIRVVERIPLEMMPRVRRQKDYLRTKKLKLGHILEKLKIKN